MGFAELLAKVGDSAVGAAAVLEEFGKNEIGPALANTGAALDRFRETTLSPALADIGGNLDKFGKEQVAPALAGAGGILEEIGKTKVLPAVTEVGRVLENFGQHQLGPALVGAGSAFDTFNKESLSPAIVGTGKSLEEFGKRTVFPALAGTVATLDMFGQNVLLPAVHDISKAAEEHPVQAGLIAASSITFVFPSLLTTPVMWVFGWTSVGPRAASIASGLQAGAGTLVAKGAFAHFQSAAMGGYGAAVVNMVTSIGAGIFGILAAVVNGTALIGEEKKSVIIL